MSLTMRMIKPPEDVSDAKDGTRLLGTVEIDGTQFHWDFIAVEDGPDGLQHPVNSDYEELYDDLQRLYATQGYQTIRVAGFPWDYVAYMHPFDR